MSKRAKQKRQSPYRRRDINPLGGLSIIASRQMLHNDQTTELTLPHWLAFENMIMHESTLFHFETVTSSINIGIVLAEMGIRPDALDIFKRALDASFSAKVRGQESNIWRYNGQDIDVIRTALTIHDDQCSSCTQGQFRHAVNTVQQRFADGCVYAEAA